MRESRVSAGFSGFSETCERIVRSSAVVSACMRAVASTCSGMGAADAGRSGAGVAVSGAGGAVLGAGGAGLGTFVAERVARVASSSGVIALTASKCAMSSVTSSGVRPWWYASRSFKMSSRSNFLCEWRVHWPRRWRVS